LQGGADACENVGDRAPGALVQGRAGLTRATAGCRSCMMASGVWGG
jgi:hypothetical protein